MVVSSLLKMLFNHFKKFYLIFCFTCIILHFMVMIYLAYIILKNGPQVQTEDEIEEVDAVLGTTSYDKIVEAINEALEGRKSLEMTDLDALPVVDSKRLVTTGGHFAYLKIAEGCDNHCTYCAIPMIRGKYRSRKIENLIKEIEEMEGSSEESKLLIRVSE